MLVLSSHSFSPSPPNGWHLYTVQIDLFRLTMHPIKRLSSTTFFKARYDPVIKFGKLKCKWKLLRRISRKSPSNGDKQEMAFLLHSTSWKTKVVAGAEAAILVNEALNAEDMHQKWQNRRTKAIWCPVTIKPLY